MGRRFPVATSPPKSLIPWIIEHSDLVPANAGTLEFERDLVLQGLPQKQLAVFVRGEYQAVLGLMAIRCERRMGATGEELTPIGIALPDEDVYVPSYQPYMDGAVQSGTNRSDRQLPDDNGCNNDDGD